MRILLGGAINIVFLNALATYLPQTLTYSIGSNDIFITWTPQLLTLILLVTLTPIPISIMLTKTQPKLRIVPPFYITLVTFAWILFSWVNINNFNTTFFAAYGGFALSACGFAEDKLIASVMGIAAERESIYYEHLKVYGDIEDVKTRLGTTEIKDALFLRDRIEEDAQHGYIFKTRRGAPYHSKISLSKDKDFPEITDVKIVYYEEGRYNLRVSKGFLEEARRASAYARDILCNREPCIAFEVVVSFTNSANTRDALVDSIIDEMRGYYVRTKKFTKMEWFKVVAFVAVTLATVALFLTEQSTYGTLAAILDGLIVISQLPDILRREK